MSERVFYRYATRKTFEAANELLENMFASGDICEAECPHIEPIKVHTFRNQKRSKIVGYAVMLPIN
jgi:hypothetical protein